MDYLALFLVMLFFALVGLSFAAFFKAARLEHKTRRLENALARQKRELEKLQRALRAGGMETAPEKEKEEEEEEEEEVPGKEPEGTAIAPAETPPSAEPLPARPPREEIPVLSRGPHAGLPPDRAGAGPSRRRTAPPRRPSFRLDEALGPRLALWVGALALALAAAFLVHYSWKKGWFTPPMRVLSGLAMGILLVAWGIRIQEKTRRMAAAFTAAGLADIYICIWAAASVWNLVPAGLGFAGLALTTAGAIVLSLLQGRMVLYIGMVGGYATPLLVPSLHPRPAVLFPYLFLLGLGILVVTLHRKWFLPSALSLLLGWAWAGSWMGLRFETSHTFWIGGFLLLSAWAYLLPCLSDRDPPPWGHPNGPYLGRLLGLGGGILLTGILWSLSHYAAAPWIFYLLLSAPALYLASRKDWTGPALTWAAMLGAALLLLLWKTAPPGGNPTALAFLTQGIQGGNPKTLVFFAAATGLFFAGGAYLLLWRSSKPHLLSALVPAAALLYFLVLYIQKSGWEQRALWWKFAAALGILLSGAAVPLHKKRESLARGDLALAGLIWGAVITLCVALPIAVREIYVTLGFALAVPLLARLDPALKVPSLRYLAALVSAAATVRLMLNSHVLEYNIPARSLFNWILFGYGLSALFFLDAARTLKDKAPVALVRWFKGNVLLFLFYLVTLQARHFFHPAGLQAGPVLLAEWGVYSSIWLLFGWILLFLARRKTDLLLEIGGKTAALLGLAAAFLAQGTSVNPLWTGSPVGETPLFNLLLLLYGAPFLLSLLLARTCKKEDPKAFPFALLFKVSALVFSFLLLSLEVRQAFHGGILKGPLTGQGENYAYSAAWALYGLGLLALGIRTGGKLLRISSLVVMGITVCKVFLFDTSHLKDLYRVFSFLCLGASLFFLAWLYQKFVFREEHSPAPGGKKEKSAPPPEP